jgi:hypothetical protein
MRPAPLLSVLLLGTFAACGGGAEDEGGKTGVPAVGGYEPPPASSDPPGNTYESPGPGEDPTGAAGACSPCEENLACSEGGDQSLTIYLRHYQGACIAVEEGEEASQGVVLACGGSLTEVSGGGVAGTWAESQGGFEFCAIVEGRMECETCSVESTGDDGGLDVIIARPGFASEAGTTRDLDD